MMEPVAGFFAYVFVLCPADEHNCVNGLVYI
jgi:hypothetical protein